MPLIELHMLNSGKKHAAGARMFSAPEMTGGAAERHSAGLIVLCGAGKRYGNGCHGLRPTSLSIAKGSFVAVIGPSGAGKSTMLRLINGLEAASCGQIRIDDETLGPRNLRRVRSRVAMVFQHFNLVNRLSVMTNVLTGRLAYRSWVGSVLYLFRPEDMSIAHECLARVGLTDKAWERADQLSGGQQQRVGIARALAQRPEVILADEPVASLDPVASEEVLSLLHQICKQDGITVVVNLHQIELATRYADRILGLNGGELVFDGPADALDAAALKSIYHRDGVVADANPELALAHA
ncbi:phosphonate ABC transporter ATP-binding protein [Methylococcus sp. Mc7]|uniref:phosphonate ABC transporter ATP-binding protein n=1 Tax=Methylococcus sp. Mc7 TaxID=2860258 RepID=UPI001C5338DB|nr:phosphonate ABC transporter ATP-binding protein [Methylococcus sp. Mc7]QXP85087.1 phosphonate ABC transporter ATP-binding protein [Methylococcus sp. Mc7]